MRPIELSLSFLTILSALLYLIPGVAARLRDHIVPGLLLALGGAQVALEGFRWQLWPLLLAILLLLLAAVLQSGAKKRPRRPVGLAAAGLILALVALAAGWLLPVPNPYPVSGSYPIGTTVFPLTDSSRTEIYGPDPAALREIMVQVWYPASPEQGNKRSQWMPDIDAAGPAIAEWIELPAFSLSHLQFVQANAFMDAPVMPGEEKFPLLIFSHGWSGFKEQNIYQVEELASHGYVVAAINHTYGAVLTVFPDGRQVLRNDDALPEGVAQETYDLASNRLVRQWAEDIGYLLDIFEQYEQTGEDWPLGGRLDLDRVGIFGHSTGGGATAEFCGTDQRCQAALVMDLWVEPVSSSVVESGLSQPVLLMHSAAWANLDEPSPNFLQVGDLIRASRGDVIEFRIKGTQHHDFSSLPLLTPLASTIGLKGPIPADRGLRLINAYSVAFFDQYLRGFDQDLLEPGDAQFSEVQFGVRP